MYHLVLADDSVTIQKVVELTFAEEDFQVRSFSDGASALEYLKDQPVDVLLVDIFLPFVDGYDLCRAVRRNALTAHIPVILLAGTFEPFDSRRAENAGYTSYVTKPFETSYLVGHVREMIARTKKPVQVQEPETATPPPREEEVPGQVFTFPIPGISNGETVNLQLRPEDCFPNSTLLRRDALVGPRIRYKRQDAAVVSAAAPAEPTSQIEEEIEEAQAALEDLGFAAPSVEPQVSEASAEEPVRAEETALPAVEPEATEPAGEEVFLQPETIAETAVEASALETAQAPAAERRPAAGLTDEQLELITQKILSRLPQELRRWLPEAAEEILRSDKQDP